MAHNLHLMYRKKKKDIQQPLLINCYFSLSYSFIHQLLHSTAGLSHSSSLMSLFSAQHAKFSPLESSFLLGRGFLGERNRVVPPFPKDLFMYDFTTNRCCIVLDLKLDVKHGKASMTALYIKLSNDIPLIDTSDKIDSDIFQLCEQKTVVLR